MFPSVLLRQMKPSTRSTFALVGILLLPMGLAQARSQTSAAIEKCCCRYVVQDRIDPASGSEVRHAWISSAACFEGYRDPLTLGRQERAPGRCVDAKLCGRNRL